MTSFLWMLLFWILLLIRIWIKNKNIKNHPKCGHVSDAYGHVPEENMWMCDECYQEWKYDKMDVGNCR